MRRVRLPGRGCHWQKPSQAAATGAAALVGGLGGGGIGSMVPVMALQAPVRENDVLVHEQGWDTGMSVYMGPARAAALVLVCAACSHSYCAAASVK